MTVAKVVALIMLVSLTLNAGLDADVAAVLRSVRRAAILARVAIANVIAVPLAAALFVRLFGVPGPIGDGILLMAVAPGVPFLLFRIGTKGGDADLALALAVFLPLLSILTVPLTLRWLVAIEGAAQIPLARVVVTLVAFQFIPIAAGVALATLLPPVARFLRKLTAILVPVSIVVFVVLFASPLWRSVGALVGSHGLFAIVCIIATSLIAGFVAGGSDERDRRTCTLGTLLRNVGFAAAIATACFPDPMVGNAVIAYLAIQIIASVVTSTYFTASARRANL